MSACGEERCEQVGEEQCCGPGNNQQVVTMAPRHIYPIIAEHRLERLNYGSFSANVTRETSFLILLKCIFKRWD